MDDIERYPMKGKPKKEPTEAEQKEALDELMSAWNDRKELISFEYKLIKAISTRLKTGL